MTTVTIDVSLSDILDQIDASDIVNHFEGDLLDNMEVSDVVDHYRTADILDCIDVSEAIGHYGVEALLQNISLDEVLAYKGLREYFLTTLKADIIQAILLGLNNGFDLINKK